MTYRLRAATLGAAAATVLAVAAGGPALAVDTAAAATGSFVLTLTPVDDTSTGQARKVTLECGPDGGTHPDPVAACAALTKVNGDFTALPRDTTVHCPTTYAPVVAAAKGTWNGLPDPYEQTFTNDCEAAVATANVFRF